MQPISFSPTLRHANGLAALEVGSVPLADGFVVAQSFLVTIPPGAHSGNHRHQRRHAFVALMPGLRLLVEFNGVIHKYDMFGDELQAWVVPENAPHAVVNVADHPACMYELNDRVRGELQVPVEVFVPQKVHAS